MFVLSLAFQRMLLEKMMLLSWDVICNGDNVTLRCSLFIGRGVADGGQVLGGSAPFKTGTPFKTGVDPD